MANRSLPKTIVKESNIKYRGVYGTLYTFTYDYTFNDVKKIIELLHDKLRKVGKTGFFRVHVLVAFSDNKPKKWYIITKTTDIQADKIKFVFHDKHKVKINAVQIVYFPKIIKDITTYLK